MKPENKPTVEQAAWLFSKIVEAKNRGSSFRHMIYDVMGYQQGDYTALYIAGGMVITNAFCESSEYKEKVDELATLARRFINDRGCTCNEADHRCGTNQMLEDLEGALDKS